MHFAVIIFSTFFGITVCFKCYGGVNEYIRETTCQNQTEYCLWLIYNSTKNWTGYACDSVGVCNGTGCVPFKEMKTEPILCCCDTDLCNADPPKKSTSLAPSTAFISPKTHIPVASTKSHYSGVYSSYNYICYIIMCIFLYWLFLMP
ncbi:hypothetical protein OESDEN_19779 [Oesophagostomum dentatum]|uniref:ET module n=1 Tax=Oesophagostomum dentatum TaxID=61180 RepID=A0A0B1SAJ5_OESDE|nr:hypothetical protein OESDEN_19779 [Oesophagostomum dentatum]